MSDLLISIVSFAAGLALGVIVTYLIVTSRKQLQWAQVRDEQRRQWRRERLLSSLEALDAGLTSLTTAALQGSGQFEQERAAGRAQTTNAANQSGDDGLRHLVGVVVAHCDALSVTGREKEGFGQLVRQLGEAQREVYRQMEMLLDQTFD